MNVDGKVVLTVAASVIGAGIVGAISSEISTARSLAGLEARLTSLKESFVSRVKEAGAQHEAMIHKAEKQHEAIRNEINARIERLDARKMDK